MAGGALGAGAGATTGVEGGDIGMTCGLILLMRENRSARG